MSRLQCPNCGAFVDSSEGWAKAALSTLMPAPAVPDMATQLRCPGCHAVFAQPHGGPPSLWVGLRPALVLLAVLLLIVWLVPG